MYFYRSIIHGLGGVLLSSALVAQAAGGPPMLTDDPGTPGAGHWEINLATQAVRAASTTTYQLPLVDANYGWGERVQLKFELPWLVQDEANGESRSGIGDGLIGVKWRFYDDGEPGWQISTYPQWAFGLPQASSTQNGLADSGTSYLLPFEFARDFAGYEVNFEWGRWSRPKPQSDSWIAGGVLTHQVGAGWELLAELHEESLLHRAQDQLVLNFGTRWAVSERYSWLLSAGRDVHNTLSVPNSFISYLGLQLRY